MILTRGTFFADKPRVWIAALGDADWDLAGDGKRVAVVIPTGPPTPPSKSTRSSCS